MKFSLIVPIYNVEKFLPQCLDSILDQDIPLEEYEIICIIDGSPDNCTNIVKEYQEKYSNIVLFEQKNSGVSTARNNGIELSKGEYLWFIDPDDFIVSNCLKFLYSELKENNYDYVDFSYTTIDENEKYNAEKYKLNINFSNVQYHLAYPWQMICKKTIYDINNLKFNTSMIYCEDILLRFQINQLELKTKQLENLVLYAYRTRYNSVANNKDFKMIREKINCLLVFSYEINKIQDSYKINNNSFFDVDYQVFSHCTNALISTFYYDRTNFKNILNKAKQMGLYPYKLKRKLHLKKCKTQKQYLLEIFEYFICKNWFATIISKFC